MKILLSLMVGTALLTTPAMAANYLIHDQDGHGVTYCEWSEAEVVTDWPGLVIPADATEVRMCFTPGDPRAALERMKANRGGGGGPIVIAPTPTTPTPTEPTPTDPEPVDPDPTDPTDPDDGDNGGGDGDHDNGHGNDDDGHDEGNPGNSDGPGNDNDDHPDLGDVVDHIKDKLCDRKPHLPFC